MRAPAGGIDPARTERLAAGEAARRQRRLQRRRCEAGRWPGFPRTIRVALSEFAVQSLATVGLAAAPMDPTAVQNRQDQKEAFIAKPAEASTRNPAVCSCLHLPTGDGGHYYGGFYRPGGAAVTEPVYDTATGRLLIPQGTRLIGRYDSQVAFGQRPILLVWTRLILPDTSSIALGKLPGAGPAGFAGLEDGVNRHWGRILAGAPLAAPQNRSDGIQVVVASRESAQDSVNEIGQELTKLNLNVQPTCREAKLGLVCSQTLRAEANPPCRAPDWRRVLGALGSRGLLQSLLKVDLAFQCAFRRPMLRCRLAERIQLAARPRPCPDARRLGRSAERFQAAG